MGGYEQFGAHRRDQGRCARCLESKVCTVPVVGIKCTGVAVVMLVIVAAMGLAALIYVVVSPFSIERFADRLSVDDMIGHLKELQEIASEHPNSMGVGSRSVLLGYNASAAYVEAVLEAEGYAPVRHYFDVPVWSEHAEAVLELKPSDLPLRNGEDFQALRFGGYGVWDFESVVRAVDVSTEPGGGGCVPGAFAPAFGAIALVSTTPDCSGNDIEYAVSQATGVRGVLIYTAGTAGTFSRSVKMLNWTVGVDYPSVPALGVSGTLATLLTDRLAGGENVTLHWATNTTITIATTFNVLADTPNAESNETVVIMGAHLDSVEHGPGINDNGSGTSILLAIATQIARTSFEMENTIRFAFWSAEEVGIVGSAEYVAWLEANGDLGTIAAMLNADMAGSPNFIRNTHDASMAPVDVQGPTLVLQKMFEAYFDDAGLAVGLSYPNSDYQSFLNAGVPANGLGSGGGNAKTVALFDAFGGTINAPCDPCYHQWCDLVENINEEVVGQFGRAFATVLLTLALDGDIHETLWEGGSGST